MHKPIKCHLCGWIWWDFFSQIVCWAPLSSRSINQCVMSCVTVRGIILQFGRGCGLTNGPGVVKTIWREQKVGLHRSFTSNIHQQFHLSLLSPCYLFWCWVCFVFSGGRLLWFLGKNKSHKVLWERLCKSLGTLKCVGQLSGLSLLCLLATPGNF